jgi:hypothetical protein
MTVMWKYVAGCQSDEECPLDEACKNRKCVKPCKNYICGSSAYCSNMNHRAVCRCLDGFVGEPTRSCAPPSALHACQYDSDCPETRICDRLNRVCRSPCMQDTCGQNAVCSVKNREATCQCFDGLTGNPYIACNRRKLLKSTRCNA